MYGRMGRVSWFLFVSGGMIYSCFFNQHEKMSSTSCLPGSEWRYVIISTVCSVTDVELESNIDGAWLNKHLGFVGDPNQINVAITRSKEGLCIIGNVAHIYQFSPSHHSIFNDRPTYLPTNQPRYVSTVKGNQKLLSLNGTWKKLLEHYISHNAVMNAKNISVQAPHH